jgi:hypothetical protein
MPNQSVCGLQAQQLAWHKHDFLNLLGLIVVALVWAVTVLVRAALGANNASHFLVSSCSAYLALVGYAALRWRAPISFAVPAFKADQYSRDPHLVSSI